MILHTTLPEMPPRVRFMPLPGAVNVPDGDPDPSVMVIDGLTPEQADAVIATCHQLKDANVRAVLAFPFRVTTEIDSQVTG